MGIIEELNIKDIVLIDKYLSKELSPEEEKAFKKRLKMDDDLMQDYLMVKNTYYKDYDFHNTLIKTKPREKLSQEEIRFHQKNKIANHLVKYGLWAALLMSLLILVSAILMIAFS